MELEKNYAPVIVSVYDRPNHFRKCIASLSKSIGAAHTTLFIASDGPRDDASREKVIEVREYIKTISGFKKVVPYLAADNTQGEIRRICRKQVKQDFDRYIRLEDDNLVAPHFLAFLNEGLDIYEDEPRVLAICGYQYPGYPRQESQAQIFLNAYSTWGFGTWRDKDRNDLITPTELFAQMMTDRTLFDQVNRGNPALPLMVYHQHLKGERAGDLANNIIINQEDLLCVFPTSTLVKNTGHDGSGINCRINKDIDAQELCTTKVVYQKDKPVELEPAIRKWHFQQKGGHFAVWSNQWIFQSLNNDFLILRKLYGFLFRLKGQIRGAIKKRLRGL